MGPFDEYFPSPNRVEIQRADRKLTYNHYCNVNKKVEIEVDGQSQIGLLGLGD